MLDRRLAACCLSALCLLACGDDAADAGDQAQAGSAGASATAGAGGSGGKAGASGKAGSGQGGATAGSSGSGQAGSGQAGSSGNNQAGQGGSSGNNQAGQAGSSGSGQAGSGQAGSQQGGGSGGSGGAPSTCPASPMQTVDTTMPSLSGKVIDVASGGDLQAALDMAQPGDTVALEAGATFTGNFTLPKKSGDGWVVIRSAAVDKLPPAGGRAVPGDAASMPRLVTPNSMPPIAAAQGAHHFRLVGLELTSSPGLDIVYNLVELGSGSETSVDQLPHDIVVDRCYVHGSPQDAVKRGVQLNCARGAVIDSTIAEIHNVGQDTQAILGWNGPGPFKIENNHLEGAAENVMFGGATPALAGNVPSDIEIRRNHFWKPLSWKEGDPSYAGKHWSVKNIFELKNARRVLLEGNVFENNWADAQSGFAWVLTPRTEGGTAPQAVVDDVLFRNNVLRHSANGMNVAGHDDDGSGETRCVRVENNLFDDIGGAMWGADGRLWQVLGGPKSVEIEHNTALQKAHITMFDGVPKGTGFVIRNNVTPHNEYGIFGSGAGEGKNGLDAFFSDYVVTGNVIPWATPNASAYPEGNSFPASLADVGFVDLAGGDYHLAGSSMFKGKATDGKDPGADIDAIAQATMGVVK